MTAYILGNPLAFNATASQNARLGLLGHVRTARKARIIPALNPAEAA